MYALIILLLYIASGNVAHISVLIYPLWCSWSPWCIGTISPAWCLYFPYFIPIVIFQQYNRECLNPAYLVLMNPNLHLVNLTFFGYDTVTSRILPNNAIDSLMKSFIKTIPFHFLKLYLNPQELMLCSSLHCKLPKYSYILSIILVLNFSSACDTLLLSTYQDIVHCLVYMILYAMHL